MDTNFV